MSTELVSRSSYTSSSLTKADAYDVRDAAFHSAKATELTKVANEEIAKIGAHTIGTMANLTSGAGQVRRQLMDSGHRSEVYDDAQNKILQVTGQNMITMANAGQKEVLQYTASRMR
jgi:hypothetical protein